MSCAIPQDPRGRTSIEQLEIQASCGEKLTADLHRVISARNLPEAAQWLDQIEKVRARCIQSAMLIGIAGATGAGKSALINALLDYERILPTNCMRACTAVITEIMYNPGETLFRAEVDLITKDEWRAELEAVLGDVESGNSGTEHDFNGSDSDLAVALAKIRAVYPYLTPKAVSESAIDTLMNHENVQCLGNTITIEADDEQVFYEKLRPFIDSKDRGIQQKTISTAVTAKAANESEIWPLIRMVRIYLKSFVLQSGLHLVDLPGVHDSNAARAAVSRRYLEQCSGIFIVAPISRAIDDKTAKTLLGKAFKQQLKLDGSYDNVTFICSKTDDISLSEAHVVLNLKEKTQNLYERLDELKVKNGELQTEQHVIKARRQARRRASRIADVELRAYRSLRKRAEKGNTVYKPTKASSPAKRKRSELSETQSQQLLCDSAVPEQPLTLAEIDGEIEHLEAKQDAANAEIAAECTALKDCSLQFKQNRIEASELHSRLYMIAIQTRNDLSQANIRRHFVEGLREIDEELAAADDLDVAESRKIVHNYDTIAQELPVFCVSSRGYQQLQGRLEKDKVVQGFPEIKYTQIPDLQKHCKTLSDSLRRQHLDSYINGVNQLCRSLDLWAGGNDETRDLTAQDLQKLHDLALDNLQKFGKRVGDINESLRNNIKRELDIDITRNLSTAVQAARACAVETCERWGARYDRFDPAAGGLHYQTYRAICRRQGLWERSATIIHDFNGDLANPFLQRLFFGWDAFFRNFLSTEFKAAAESLDQEFCDFETRLQADFSRLRSKPSVPESLKQQILSYRKDVTTAVDQYHQELKNSGKSANRLFAQRVAREMAKTYVDCITQTGPGSYQRMKEIMIAKVDSDGARMFQKSSQKVDQYLVSTTAAAGKAFDENLGHVIRSLGNDCNGALAHHNRQLMHEQRLLREDVLKIIRQPNGACDEDGNGTIEDNSTAPVQITQTTCRICPPSGPEIVSDVHIKTQEGDVVMRDTRSAADICMIDEHVREPRVKEEVNSDAGDDEDGGYDDDDDEDDSDDEDDDVNEFSQKFIF